MKLLDAASQLPRPFDVVLLDDTSRLSRNIGDIARAFEGVKKNIEIFDQRSTSTAHS